MALEKNDCHSDLRNLHDKCKKYVYYHITLTMMDGRSFDGIIENVAKDMITVLVGEDMIEQENEDQADAPRQNYGYGRPRRTFRRFRRQNFPIGTLAALALLPYIAPPAYPYYPYY